MGIQFHLKPTPDLIIDPRESNPSKLVAPITQLTLLNYAIFGQVLNKFVDEIWPSTCRIVVWKCMVHGLHSQKTISIVVSDEIIPTIFVSKKTKSCISQEYRAHSWVPSRGKGWIANYFKLWFTKKHDSSK